MNRSTFLADHMDFLTSSEIELLPLSRRFPQKMNTVHGLPPPHDSLSTRARLQSYFEEHPHRTTPFKHMIDAIRKRFGNTVTTANLQPSLLIPSRSIQRILHMKDGDATRDDFRLSVRDFCLLIVETGLMYPLIRDLRDPQHGHPADAADLYESAHIWADREFEKRNTIGLLRLSLREKSAQYLADALVESIDTTDASLIPERLHRA